MGVEKTLAELATLLSATVQGDPSCVISGVATLQTAHAGQVSFLDNVRYRKYLANTQASAVILTPDEARGCPVHALITDNPYLGYAKVARLFEQVPKAAPGIHPSAVIGEDCQIDPSASIGPLCVIGSHVVIGQQAIIGAGSVVGDHCRIGSHTRLWSRVTLYHDVHLGQRVIIHSGAVIGSDGFGIARDRTGWHKVPQLGGVRLGDDVEIGANTTIDRGAIGHTVVEEGAKLDNQIQVAHNVHIGAHTAIAGCVGISGSTKIGRNCMIGGGTCIAGHLEIADGVIITGMAMVMSSLIQAGLYSSGIGVQPNRVWRKNAARFRQLDEIARRLHTLETSMKDKKDE